MTSSTPSDVMAAILPCNDLDASEHFYNRLGFKRLAGQCPPRGEPYRTLANGSGGYSHLTDAVEGRLVPAETRSVSISTLKMLTLLQPNSKTRSPANMHRKTSPGGVYEFALSHPDQTLVRIGWPTRLRRPS